MESTLQVLTNILISPPGSLAYHLILAFSVVWSLQTAFSTWNTHPGPAVQRLLAGLSLILIGRLVLFVPAILSNQGTILPESLLPTLDRALAVLSILIIAWLWTVPKSARLPDAAFGLLFLLGTTLTGLSLAWWSNQPTPAPFNSTWLNTAWSGYALVILTGALLALVIRRPVMWGLGFGMLGLLLAGHGIQLLLPALAEDYPSAVRLVELAAYPLLLTLPQRMLLLQPAARLPGDELSPAQRTLLFQTLQGWLAYEANPDQPQGYRSLAEILCRLFAVEAAAILVPEAPELTRGRLFSYERVADFHQENIPLTDEQVPILWNALSRLRPIRMHTRSTADLDQICEALELPAGNLLAVPVVQEEKQWALALLLFTFRTEQTWSNADQDLAVEFAKHLTQVLHRTRLIATSDERAATVTPAVAIESPEQLPDMPGTVRSLLDALQAENTALRAQIAALQQVGEPQDSEQVEFELRLTLAELARLQKQLSAADQKYLQLTRERAEGGSASPRLDSEHMEVMMSIAQELRQPMSSIIGYTDLLLGESVGILGALQKKFLERVKASTERIGALIEDLIQITAIAQDQIMLEEEMVDLSNVIDVAIAQNSARIREKNIILRIDLPEDLPKIEADQDALQQVFMHLIQNAGAVSPVEGEILLTIRDERDEREDQDYVLIQITDSGGGIPPEDLPRVFSRLYRAENTLIQGVGDTGVGLSVAKSLVEALDGRIWVDTILGKGSTFSVLLPTTRNGSADEEPDWSFQ
jgi:signal transduction histidine kinase